MGDPFSYDELKQDKKNLVDIQIILDEVIHRKGRLYENEDRTKARDAYARSIIHLEADRENILKDAVAHNINPENPSEYYTQQIRLAPHTERILDEKNKKLPGRIVD